MAPAPYVILQGLSPVVTGPRYLPVPPFNDGDSRQWAGSPARCMDSFLRLT